MQCKEISQMSTTFVDFSQSGQGWTVFGVQADNILSLTWREVEKFTATLAGIFFL